MNQTAARRDPVRANSGHNPSPVSAGDPLSRRRLFALTGGLGAAAFLAACGDDEPSSSTTSTQMTTTAEADQAMADQFGEGDLGIVNYALTLEYLETAFYEAAAASGLFKGSELALVKMFGEHEKAHADALAATAKQLGGPVAEAPMAEFPLDSREQVLELARTVENLGAAAYLGQAPRIESPDVLAAALSIHTVEGRHAAALNVLTGAAAASPEGAFAQPADMETVLAAVQPYLV